MINNKKLLQELLEKIKNTPDQIIEQAIDKLSKEEEEKIFLLQSQNENEV